MPIYDIAGLKVKIVEPHGRTEKQARAYLSANQDENQKIDIEISVSPDRINNAMAEHPELSYDDWEYMLSGNDFYTKVIRFDGILLHSSCVVLDNVAYAFSADSGVGKSVHTKLWLEHFKDRAYILNDDKPCIRKIGNTIYACGTPWSGTDDISVPRNVELGGICFIERSKENWIKPAETKKAIFNIFSQTVKRLGPKAMDKLMDVVDDIFSNIPLYEFGCNISDDAVLTSFNALSKKFF